MRPLNSSVFVNIAVTRVMNVDGNDKQTIRQTLTFEVTLDSGVVDYMKPYDIQKWLTDLYKKNELNANQKSFDELADELTTRVADEFEDMTVVPVRAIKILNGNYGVTYTYG